MAPYENPTAWIATARTLAELEAGVASCQLCPLGQSRKRTFFGRGGTAKEGTGHVPVMLILDPPDINDAEAGQTPSGPLATLLDNIVRGGLKMSPEEIYVTPAVKCPPEDPDEILPKTNSYCRLIALKEIELAAPLEIIALGHTPSRILTGVDLPFYRILQNPRYKNIRVRDRQIPLSITFGLRSMDTDDTTDLKKDAWSKIKQVLRRLGRLP
jgi:uracil-DNA glycosylase family 4